MSLRAQWLLRILKPQDSGLGAGGWGHSHRAGGKAGWLPRVRAEGSWCGGPSLTQGPVEGRRPSWGCSGLGGACLTCDIEVGIARSLAQLVGNDTLVDASMLRSHSREHQAMDIPVWGVGGDNDTGPEPEGYSEGWAHAPRGLAFYPYRLQGAGKGARVGQKARSMSTPQQSPNPGCQAYTCRPGPSCLSLQQILVLPPH